jgi:hypothetical protein
MKIYKIIGNLIEKHNILNNFFFNTIWQKPAQLSLNLKAALFSYHEIQ